MLNVKIGADPEFAVFHNGRWAEARKFFYGCDSVIGLDGNSSTGELRPRPSDNILAVVADIRNIFKETALQLDKNVELRAGNYQGQVAIGGHIHVERKGEERTNRVMNLEIVQRIDAILTSMVEPFFDDLEGRRDRQNSGNYGIRDYREGAHYKIQNHGLEYRPACSWLLSPEIATIFLGLAKMAVLAWDLDLPRFKSAKKSFKAYLEELEAFPSDVRMAVKLYFETLEATKGQPLDYSQDILKNWGVR